jgi:hypothetical protein
LKNFKVGPVATWPQPSEEIEWLLRYGGDLTDAHQMHAASILDAYRHLLSMPASYFADVQRAYRNSTRSKP